MSASRLVLIASVAALALSACNRDRDKAAPDASPSAPGAAATPAEAGAPLGYESGTPYASVKLSLPPALKAQPDLHAALYAAAVRDLRQFVEGAQADRTEAGTEPGMAPYEKTIEFKPAAETGKLLSLERVDYDFTGGAHGNSLFAGVLWDKALKRQITTADLFRKGADSRALDQALCAAINAAKKERSPDAEPVSLGGTQWSCPRALTTPFVLTPGTVPGKAGGLTFLIGPYQVGPYAEGPYEIVVPQSVFRALIAPAYAEEFAGAPIKSGDARPAQG
ncbi:DUF3298 and DUF4163 domain-containing protein [Brevundimonas sp.]|uniref:DUF3298 and DUF4163 domain-containing protein n=1 Tax=Brevundimonas sp. TaxID=1871086 RepID=UPI002FDB45D3